MLFLLEKAKTAAACTEEAGISPFEAWIPLCFLPSQAPLQRAKGSGLSKIAGARNVSDVTRRKGFLDAA